MTEPIITNPNPTAEVPAGALVQPGAATPTFDELLSKNPAHQAEFDRRVAKALQTAQAKAAEGTKKVELTVEELKKQIDTQNAALADYINREAAVKAGVDPRFLNFVAFEVKSGLADGTDFGTALDAYVKANPQYLAAAQPQTPPAAWGARQTGPGATPPSGVEAAFKALNPNLKIE